MSSKSYRDLWHLITATDVLRPKEVIQESLNRNKDSLQAGLLSYLPYSSSSQANLMKNNDVGDKLKSVAEKFSKLVNLDAVQAYDIVYSFLLHDYTECVSNINQYLSEERKTQQLLSRLREYYNSERIYLQKIVKHALCYWQDGGHPYREVYADFIEELCQDKRLETSLLECFYKLSDDLRRQATDEKLLAQVIEQTMREQSEVLECLILFYKVFEHDSNKLLQLLEHIKKHSFESITRQDLLQGSFDYISRKNSYLQVLLIIEGFDLENWCNLSQEGTIENHHLLKHKDMFSQINEIFSSFVNLIHSGPLLLMWSVLKLTSEENIAEARKFGGVSLKLGVFNYLCDMLESDCLKNNVLAEISNTLVYGLMNLTLATFHDENLMHSNGFLKLVSILMTKPYISQDVLDNGFETGLGAVVESCSNQYPFNFESFMDISISLASSGELSSQKIGRMLRMLPYYTEEVTISDLDVMFVDECICLRSFRKTDRFQLLLPAGTMGTILSNDGSRLIVQWQITFNIWQVFDSEINLLLDQTVRGLNAVAAEDISRATTMYKLLENILKYTYEDCQFVTALLEKSFYVLEKFSSQSYPPLDLITHCLRALNCVAEDNPMNTWHRLQQNGFLPHTGLSATHSDSCRSILAGVECVKGTYSVTIALLDFMMGILEPLYQMGDVNILTPCLEFVCSEVFPYFLKWRYQNIADRELIGEKCLTLFHGLLNLDITTKRPGGSGGKNQRPRVIEQLTEFILFGESGQCLLDIIAIGISNLEAALCAQQTNSPPHAVSIQSNFCSNLGVDVTQLVILSMSVLNRLLLLKQPANLESPVEVTLSAPPVEHAKQHIVATIAQYTNFRNDRRIPALAMVLLKRIAKAFPMSILACLGSEADYFRAVVLSRLQAQTEDLHLKVVILEFLSTCVEMQPGLTELFLNVVSDDKTKDQQMRFQNLEIGNISCLQTVLKLFSASRQGTYLCPPVLLCAVTEFLLSLWKGKRETATAVLRKQQQFWDSLGACLKSNSANIDAESELMHKKHKYSSNAMWIMSSELFSATSKDTQVNKLASSMVAEEHVSKWSKYIRSCLEDLENVVDVDLECESVTSVMSLLVAWRGLLVVLANKSELLPKPLKLQILGDLVTIVNTQLRKEVGPLQNKIAGICSSFCISDWLSLVHQLNFPFEVAKLNDLPSIQGSMGAALVLAMQNISSDKKNDVMGQLDFTFISFVCDILCSSHSDILAKEKLTEDGEKQLRNMLQIRIMSLTLLEESIRLAGNYENIWLQPMKTSSLFASLLKSIQQWLLRGHGNQPLVVEYVQSVFRLFIAIASHQAAAEQLAHAELTESVCMSLLKTADVQRTEKLPLSEEAVNHKTKHVTWAGVFCLALLLQERLVEVLRHNFRDGVLTFIGVHSDRILNILRCEMLDSESLRELQLTCQLIRIISRYHSEWRFHWPAPFLAVRDGVCSLVHKCALLLSRPASIQVILQSKLEHCEIYASSPTKRLFLHKLSDTYASDGLQAVQKRLYDILALSVDILQHFTPSLHQVLDLASAVSEYDMLLDLSFASPSPSQECPLSYGSLVSCAQLSLSFIIKGDGRSKDSPDKLVETSSISGPIVVYILENVLVLLMSQAARALRDTSLSNRQKQYLKRELSAEMLPLQKSMMRHLRSGRIPGSATPSSTSCQLKVCDSGEKQSVNGYKIQKDPLYYKLVDIFMKHILR